jgi:hypothetical protein
MTYTFWLHGALIGTSELENDCGIERSGAFHPTAHGRRVLPRLTPALAPWLELTRDLGTHLRARGTSVETVEPEEISAVAETSPAGRHFQEVGRLSSHVEMRAPDGTPIALASIAFGDLEALHRSLRELGCDTVGGTSGLPPGIPPFVVSAIFSAGTQLSSRGAFAS